MGSWHHNVDRNSRKCFRPEAGFLGFAPNHAVSTEYTDCDIGALACITAAQTSGCNRTFLQLRYVGNNSFLIGTFEPFSVIVALFP